MTSQDNQGVPRSPTRRRLRILGLGLGALAAPFLLYLLSALVLAAIPVNRSWQPTLDGPTIYVLSNGVHIDLLLPAEAAGHDLRQLLPLTDGSGRERAARWVGFGWGERRFYLETPEWSDLRLSTALAAMLIPTETLMHVTHHWRAPEEGVNCVELRVSEEELARLTEKILGQFQRNEDDSLAPIPLAGYGDRDDFYEARGSYHLFQTCNDWANQCLAESGLPAALWSPADGPILDHARSAR